MTRRIAVAGPLCGVTGLLILGAADSVFADPRVFFALWFVAGCAASGIRGARDEVGRIASPRANARPGAEGTETDLRVG